METPAVEGRAARQRTHGTKEGARPSPEPDAPTKPDVSQVVANVLPQGLAVVAMLSFIFGGCCSNVRLISQTLPHGESLVLNYWYFFCKYRFTPLSRSFSKMPKPYM